MKTFVSTMTVIVLFLLVSCSADQYHEEEVTVGVDTPYELGGTLTIPTQWSEPGPVVLLVHGSGPSDRDQNVFAYHIFKDIAHGLAQKGIASLRYDKRTYTYADGFDHNSITDFTVETETITDALLAAELLQKDKRFDKEQIYLIGHSQGGMLAPRINATADNDFAGLIIMAGSPRSLWEIIYDQNQAALAEMDSDSVLYQLHKNQIDDEYQKALALADTPIEVIKSETIFGIPAYYFKEMDQFNSQEALQNATIPLLVLQGENDFQVNIEKDFGLYQELLKDNPQARLITYPDLNHFFVRSQGENIGTIEEYQEEGEIDPQVLDDIANWILNH
ncbi:alpha/beta hydrolase family protein [Amphibacillus sediminis]|uniref:alpha/beta hydrolase family protein n=1 Tax=Amphibacillus sediminis TaxID=360185 RepID=UPI00082B8B21|nr:alpha/beta hydrolase [Amphibacillus sediminis]